MLPTFFLCITNSKQDLKATVKKTVRWTVFRESVDDSLTMNKPHWRGRNYGLFQCMLPAPKGRYLICYLPFFLYITNSKQDLKATVKKTVRCSLATAAGAEQGSIALSEIMSIRQVHLCTTQCDYISDGKPLNKSVDDSLTMNKPHWRGRNCGLFQCMLSAPKGRYLVVTYLFSLYNKIRTGLNNQL